MLSQEQVRRGVDQLRQQEPIQQADLQRQAVIGQLGQPPAGQPQSAQAPADEPRARNMGTFARGGETRQLPSMAGQNAEKLAKTGLSVAGTAAGAFNPVTIGTNYAADKLRVKEELPTFGGEFGDLTDDYGRRFEGTGGGVKSEALRYAGYGSMAGPIGAGIGAAAGAIKALATKNAPSAYSDFSSEDAADAVAKGYQKYLGREASEDEIKNQLVGQGWNPEGGDRWVGEKGLFSVLGQIRDSPEAQQFRETGMSALQRQALMQQMAGGGSPAAAAQTAAGAQGAATGGGGGGGSVANPGTWNTDGYAAPGFVPEKFGAVPPGWDAEKWNNPDHQTPKYGVGRILSNYPPTVEGLASAIPEIQKAYPGTTFNGKDRINIPGVGEVDVLKGASKGGEEWRWGADEGGAAPDAAAGGVATAGPADTGGPLTVADLNDPQRMDQIRAELERILKNEPPRQELLQQLGAANG